MKPNSIEKDRHVGMLATLAVILGALVVGAFVGADKLRSLYLEQSVITDMAAQVTITSGKMVKADVIAENLGLRVGANLATIDFAEKREKLLERVPNLLSIHVSRKLPDKITVTAEERVPIARLEAPGSRKASGRVVDTEGMVFIWQRGTQTLPIIRENQTPGLPKGHRIKGRANAALRLIEACREPELLELGILEVDTTKHDFLVATLGNYSKVKILWEDMDEPTPDSHANLVRRLTNLRDAIRSRISPDTVIWKATIKNRIFADTQEKL